MAERAPERAYYDSVVDAVDAARDELVEISKDIHANPELNYEEHHAAAVLSDALERHGFAIERGVGGFRRRFVASQTGVKAVARQSRSSPNTTLFPGSDTVVAIT